MRTSANDVSADGNKNLTVLDYNLVLRNFYYSTSCSAIYLMTKNDDPLVINLSAGARRTGRINN